MRAWKTLLVCCLSFIMLLSLGMTTGLAEGEQDSAATQSKIEEPERLSEVVELREKSSKTYQLSDGTYEWVGYAEDIHYEDSNGKLKEINNAITDKPAKEGYTYSNTENAWHAYFADSLGKKNAVVLEKDNYSIAFSMADAQIQSKAKKSSVLDKSKSEFDEMLAEDNRAVVYKDVLKDVDIAYTVGTNVLKEDIILRTAPAPNVFEFDVTMEGLTILEKERVVFLVNSEGQEVFNLAPMYMKDANGKYSDKVEYTIEQHKDGYKLTVTADKEFLNASDTQYPVIVDPDYMISSSSTKDTCVDQQYPNSNYYLSQNLWTGGLLSDTNGNAMRTFMEFTLPTNIAPAAVTSAYLRIKRNQNAVPTIKAYRVTTSWNSNEVKWAAPYQPSWDGTPVSDQAVSDSNDWYRLNNLKNTVVGWMAGTYANHGFALKEPSETNTNQKTRYYSSDAPSPNKPELHIVYDSTAYLNISYNGNGNTGGTVPLTQWFQPLQSVALRANTGNLTKTGCTLLGWNTNSAGTGTSYTFGQIITPYSSLTLYAEWSSPTSFSITYNGNGNTGGSAPASQSVTPGQSVTLRTNTGNLTRTGCTLSGWNTNSAGTGAHYTLGQTLTPYSSLTLYAEWSYTITYNGNDNTGGSAPASQSVVAGQSIALRMNTGNLTKLGHVLSGWNANSAGTGANYTLGQTITPTSNLTLYAKWDQSIVRLFYYDSGVPTNIPTIRGYFKDAGYDASSYYCTPADTVRSYIGQSQIVHIEGHGAGGCIECTATPQTVLTATGYAAYYYPLSETYSTTGLPDCKFIFFSGCDTANSSDFGDLDDYAYYTLGVDCTLAFDAPIGYHEDDPSIKWPHFNERFYYYIFYEGKTVRDAAEAASEDSKILWAYFGLDHYIVLGDTTF